MLEVGGALVASLVIMRIPETAKFISANFNFRNLLSTVPNRISTKCDFAKFNFHQHSQLYSISFMLCFYVPLSVSFRKAFKG